MIAMLAVVWAYLSGLFDVHHTPALLTAAVPVMLRFADLKERGIVRNWVTLERWKRLYGFPSGRLVGPNCRLWTEDEIADYLASRPTKSKRVIAAEDHQQRDVIARAEEPPAKRGPGRPRKNPPQEAAKT